MRHRKAWKQLSRNSSHRRALLRNMVTSLLKHGQIETTDAKAKSIRPLTEKMITLAKRGDLHARRQALAYIQEKSVANKLFDELRQRHLDRQGGYVRIIKKGIRKGDGAPVSIVQLVSVEGDKRPPKKKAAKSKKATEAAGVVAQQDLTAKKEDAVTEKTIDTPEASLGAEGQASVEDGIEAKQATEEDAPEKTSSASEIGDGEVKEENTGGVVPDSSEKGA